MHADAGIPNPHAAPIWLVSPYHTGSHRAWADGYVRHSRHPLRLLTMAGRFWKWRMQGGPLELAELARQALADGVPRAILATDMVNLPAWLGLSGANLPAACRSRSTCTRTSSPIRWRPGEKPDLTYAMLNWLSQVAADRVIFNSAYHLEAWFDELPRLLRHFPDYNHLEPDRHRAGPVRLSCRWALMWPRQPPCVRSRPVPRRCCSGTSAGNMTSGPDRFFHLLYRLQEDGVDFQVAVAGENFRNVPEEFEVARTRLADRIVHWGFVDDVAAYRQLLARADLVISTAMHEFFGISVLEAIAAGAFPLLPAALSYPELIPAELHPACLYHDDDDLYAKARTRLDLLRPAPPSLQDHVRTHFAWPVVAAQYDALLDELVAI